MMDCTDRHDRHLLRLISRHARLYTEMLTANAVIHGDRDHLLAFASGEHPVALQLGGADPLQMAEAAAIGAEYGYDEININVGCPSDRVRSGRFGACLMAEPALVAEIFAAMQAAVRIPVTVKCRIGIDEQDEWGDLRNFVDVVAGAGCETFVVHARKAWLQGLSPRENRTVPPLRYERARQLKALFPHLTVVVNGGIETLEQALAFLDDDPDGPALDGVMLGRAPYARPYLLAQVDRLFFGDHSPVRSPREVMEAYADYARAELAHGARLGALSRHIVGLLHGMPGARIWRRYLSEHAHREGVGAELFGEAWAAAQSTGATNDLSGGGPAEQAEFRRRA